MEPNECNMLSLLLGTFDRPNTMRDVLVGWNQQTKSEN